MLWHQAVFRRGSEVHDMWEHMFSGGETRLLYIAGRGFDVRTQSVLQALVDSIREADAHVSKAELVLVAFPGYNLSQELKDETEGNARDLEAIFRHLGDITPIELASSTNDDDYQSVSNALSGIAPILWTVVSCDQAAIAARVTRSCSTGVA